MLDTTPYIVLVDNVAPGPVFDIISSLIVGNATAYSIFSNPERVRKMARTLHISTVGISSFGSLKDMYDKIYFNKDSKQYLKQNEYITSLCLSSTGHSVLLSTNNSPQYLKEEQSSYVFNPKEAWDLLLLDENLELVAIIGIKYFDVDDMTIILDKCKENNIKFVSTSLHLSAIITTNMEIIQLVESYPYISLVSNEEKEILITQTLVTRIEIR